MSKSRFAYPPNAKLYKYRFKEDDGLPRLIGTDPANSEILWFRWIHQPHGWEHREPWTAPVLEQPISDELTDNAFGAHSGWPGAIPLTRPPGRPKIEREEEDRPVSISTSMRRAELFEIMARAAASKQSVSEWVAAQLRTALSA